MFTHAWLTHVCSLRRYCPPINSPDLDHIPEHIAAFGVDMAEWVAFKADHEALSRVIAGVNPEEMVYADDDIEVRRRSLLDELRREFEMLINISSPDAGALRLEARHKFGARMMDAIDSALSKHDQVLITGSSRASRIKAAVPACVACDRPLRTKARKGKLMEEEGKQRKEGKEGAGAGVGMGDTMKGREGPGGMTGSLKNRPASGERPNTADPAARMGRTGDASEGGFVGGGSGGGRAGGTNAGGEGAYVLRGGFKMPRREGKLTPMGETMLGRYSPELEMGATVAYGERVEEDDRRTTSRLNRPQSAKR